MSPPDIPSDPVRPTSDERTVSVPDRQIPNWAAWALFLLMLAAFLGARSWDVRPVVFPEDGTVRLLGVDPWFHVRHAEYSRDHFPDLMRNDPGARYPNHGQQQVSGLFNLGMGGAALVLGVFSDDPTLLDRVAAWTPVLLAGLVFLLLFLFARKLGGPGLGLGACLIVLLFPGSMLSRSMLGFADQHILEVLLALGTVAGLVLAVRSAAADTSAETGFFEALRVRPGRSFLHALPFALFFYSWLGAPIYIVPVALSVLAALLFVVWTGRNASFVALACARYFGSVVLIQLVVFVLRPEWVVALGARTQWWIWLGLWVLAVLPYGYVLLLRRLPSRIPGWVVALSTLLVFVGACLLFFGAVPKGRFFWNQLTGIRGLRVSEQADILWVDLWDRFGVPGIMAALSIPLALASWMPSRDRLLRLMTGVFALVVFLIWLRTHDFDYAPPVLLGLAGALGIEQVLGWIRKGLSRLPGPAMPYRIALGICALAMLAPFGLRYPPFATSAMADSLLLHRAAWFDAMTWLRENTPEPSPGPVDPVTDATDYSDSYGVMSAWDHGNFISYIGRRLPALSRFPGRRDGLWLTAPTEEASFEPMCPACDEPWEQVRYAVLSAELVADLYLPKAVTADRPPQMQVEGYWQLPGQRVPHMTYGDAYRNSLAYRLIRQRGADLERYRIVYQSPQTSVVYARHDPIGRTMTLHQVRTDTPPGAEFLRMIANRTVVGLPDGVAYDFAVVPQVMIVEITPPWPSSGER